MTPITVFVGSSSEAKPQAKVLIRDLASPAIRFLPWWDTFTPGHLLLNDLADVRDKASAALLLFTPDIPAKLRRSKAMLPNQNVLFELGYFFSAFDASQIALVRYGATHIPKDLDGYTHIPGSRFFKPGASVVAGKKTRTSFSRWIDQLTNAGSSKLNDQEARFRIVDCLAEDAELQFIILMHESRKEIARDESYIYERERGSGRGSLAFRGHRLEGTGLVAITGNGGSWSLTQEGHGLAEWLTAKGRKCQFFWSPSGTWGTPKPGGEAEKHLKGRMQNLNSPKAPEATTLARTPAADAPVAPAVGRASS